MKKLLKKEMKLTASPLSYLFLVFVLMAFIPNYPILLCGFFICFGIFHSFQAGREASDILYTAMLPVEKADVVRAKYAFSVLIQLSGFALLIPIVAVRMAFCSEVSVYTKNAMMNGNPALLGYYLIVCACFNFFFIRSFFKSAYNIGIPFLMFGITAFLVITVAEILHHLPGCAGLNAASFDTVQLIPCVAGLVIYAIVTAACIKTSKRNFEKLDL